MAIAVCTVKEIRDALEGLPDEALLHFGGGLTFNRIKRWNDNKEFVFEFLELEADLRPSFTKKHPEIQVAFCKHEPFAGLTKVTFIPSLK